jgi:hypothetical protein
MTPIGQPAVPRHMTVGTPFVVPRSHPYYHAKLKRYTTDPDPHGTNLLLRRQAAQAPKTPTEEDMLVLERRFGPELFRTPSPVGTPKMSAGVVAKEGRTKAGRAKRAGKREVCGADARRTQMERILAATMAMETVRRDALVMEVDGELKE